MLPVCLTVNECFADASYSRSIRSSLGIFLANLTLLISALLMVRPAPRALTFYVTDRPQSVVK